MRCKPIYISIDTAPNTSWGTRRYRTGSHRVASCA